MEPVEVFYVLMFTTSNVVRDNLFIDKVCQLDFHHSQDICRNLKDHQHIKGEVMLRVTDLQIYDGILVALPAAVFSLFVGNWSDKRGRKLLLIFPFIGNIAEFLTYMINNYFFYELNSNYLLFGSTLGLTGGYYVLNLGLYGYISDITSPADRTMRLSILNGLFSAAYVVGTMLGGYLFTAIESYYVIFGISTFFALCGIFYTIFFVKESIEPVESVKFFDIHNIKECLKTAYKQRPGSARFHVFLLVVNFAIFMFCLNTGHYDYLLMIQRFDWKADDYSTFLIVKRAFRFSGLFLILPLLSRFVHDGIVASVGTALTIIAYSLIAVGQEEWMMFVATAFQINSVVTVCIRSQCTKSVSKEEIGKVFAVVSFAQALVPLAANPLFGYLYKEFLHSLPGAYLLALCGLLAVSFISSIYLYINLRNTPEETPIIENEAKRASTSENDSTCP